MTFYVTGPQLTKADIARITLRRTEVDDFAWADRHRAKDVLPTLVALQVGYRLHNCFGSAYYIEKPTPETP
ncbi:hypothetical protein [Streptomyces sp. NBC_01615]|uniref:hypothetical protein n=1 Tax=Streptomyces sp. NBC_01615 TaxID=2975898 RepID=UPI0038662CE0